MTPTEQELKAALEYAATSTDWAVKILAAEVANRPTAVMVNLGTADRIGDVMRVSPGQKIGIELTFGFTTLKLVAAAVVECPRGKADVELVTTEAGEQSLVVTSIEKTRNLDPEYIDSEAVNDIISNMGAPDDVWDTDDC